MAQQQQQYYTNNNVQMPLFASASGTVSQSFWGDVDNIDVDILAEYLLDDIGTQSGGVSFDFPIDPGNHDSNVVSPEESVDGNQAVENHTSVPYQATAGAYVPQQQMASYQVPNSMAFATGSHSGASIQQQQQHNMQLSTGQHVGGTMYYHVPGTEINPATLTKRRRLEHGEGQPIDPAVQQTYAMHQQHVHDPKKDLAVPADRRRERNKILARRTRLRKKFFFESLQKEVIDLQRENEMLKDLVRMDIGGDVGKEILDSCDAVQRMPQGVLEACREGGMGLDSQDFNLVNSIEASQQSFIITDPSLTDNPIVFASDGFIEVTGYAREQVLGRNCRFLQGTDTNKETVEEIRRNLAMGEDVSVTILNYTADGTPFWNKQFIAALRDAQNNIVNYIGVVVKVASPEPGHPDFGKVIVNGKLTIPTATTSTENASSDETQNDADNDDNNVNINNNSTGQGHHYEAESALLALEDTVSAAVAAASSHPRYS